MLFSTLVVETGLNKDFKYNHPEVSIFFFLLESLAHLAMGFLDHVKRSTISALRFSNRCKEEFNKCNVIFKPIKTFCTFSNHKRSPISFSMACIEKQPK